MLPTLTGLVRLLFAFGTLRCSHDLIAKYNDMTTRWAIDADKILIN